MLGLCYKVESCVNTKNVATKFRLKTRVIHMAVSKLTRVTESCDEGNSTKTGVTLVHTY